MSVKKIGTQIWVSGVVLVGVAVVWWFQFFSSELDRASAAVFGASPRLVDLIGCLSVSEGACAVISGLARVGGRMSYEPALLWTGLAALWTGASLRIVAEWRSPALPVRSRPVRSRLGNAA